MPIQNNRPTSPHLQIYRLPLTAVISITHRITGVILSAGLLLIVLVLYALAGGADSYAALQSMTDTIVVKLLFVAFVYALFFHLCHGVRHLIWDAGNSFDLAVLNRYAMIELAVSLLLTVTVLAWGSYGL